jgi:Plasmid pRiA4b ORF-3-like protein
MTSGDDLRDLAGLARECELLDHAVVLGRWIGTSTRQLTPGKVLRKADVPAAGAALGVPVPAKLRTMTDLPALHRPWRVAVAAGLLRIDDGQVTGGPALGSWPPADAELLGGWLAGLRAVCAAESDPRDEDGVRLLALALLTVIAEGRRPANRRAGLWGGVMEVLPGLADRYGKWLSSVMNAAGRYGDRKTGDRLVGLVALLAEFGAVTGDPSKPVITPLGRWAAARLADGLPAPADPDWSAGQMIAAVAQFSDDEQQAHVARGWLGDRDPVEAAREILTAAENLSPLLRGAAVNVVDLLGEDALPAWRELSAAPRVGPLARAVLAAWDEGPEPGDADWRWLAVEAAAESLADKGPDEVLTRVWDTMPGDDLDARLAALRATGHPDAEVVARAVAEFAASGAPRSIDQVAELKVSLPRSRPLIWRKVQLPVTVTLTDLHVVIQILFGWDGDHLHVFTVGNVQYAAPFVRLEEVRDADEVRVQDVLTSDVRKIDYTYDLGACWEHEITLVKTLGCDPARTYPVCLGFAGDSPVEYWDEEEPEEPQPFDLAEVNQRLAALVERG